MSSCTNQKSCSQSDEAAQGKSQSAVASLVEKEDVMAGINLTVAEGKRLIAKGIASMPVIREKMKKGVIIITRGSTNTYVAEELAGLDSPHGAFLTGHFVPEGAKKLNAGIEKKVTEIVLVDGKRVDVSYEEGLKMLKPGDIILKGGNMLNYTKGQVGVCIGAADGGTVYRFIPFVGKDKAQLIVPIGLEKDGSSDLNAIEADLRKNNERLGFLPKIHVYKDAMVFTEIEALKLLADVKVFPYGVGGVNGREGGISLVVAGSRSEVEKVLQAVKAVRGEKPFHE